MSPWKEPAYFATDLRLRFMRSWHDYLELFQEASEEQTAIGEASTCYLFSRRAVPDIEAQLPGARFIAMIRDPVEMAYSLHQQQIYNGNESITDFDDAWHLSPDRRSGRKVPRQCREPLVLDYQEFCKLGDQLERLISQVPRERILILSLDSLKEDPQAAYSRTLEFLGLPDNEMSEFHVRNSAKAWRSAWLGTAFHVVKRAVRTARHTLHVPPKRRLGVVNSLRNAGTQKLPRAGMAQGLREELQAFYAEDVRKLEGLLGKEFVAWR